MNYSELKPSNQYAFKEVPICVLCNKFMKIHATGVSIIMHNTDKNHFRDIYQCPKCFCMISVNI